MHPVSSHQQQQQQIVSFIYCYIYLFVVLEMFAHYTIVCLSLEMRETYKV